MHSREKCFHAVMQSLHKIQLEEIPCGAVQSTTPTPLPLNLAGGYSWHSRAQFVGVYIMPAN